MTTADLEVIPVTSWFSDPPLLFVSSVACKRERAISETGTQWGMLNNFYDSYVLLFLQLSTGCISNLRREERQTVPQTGWRMLLFCSVHMIPCCQTVLSLSNKDVLLKHCTRASWWVDTITKRNPRGNHFWHELLFGLFLIFIFKMKDFIKISLALRFVCKNTYILLP